MLVQLESLYSSTYTRFLASLLQRQKRLREIAVQSSQAQTYYFTAPQHVGLTWHSRCIIQSLHCRDTAQIALLRQKIKPKLAGNATCEERQEKAYRTRRKTAGILLNPKHCAQDMFLHPGKYWLSSRADCTTPNLALEHRHGVPLLMHHISCSRRHHQIHRSSTRSRTLQPWTARMSCQATVLSISNHSTSLGIAGMVVADVVSLVWW